jgi:hypothetical protein
MQYPLFADPLAYICDAPMDKGCQVKITNSNLLQRTNMREAHDKRRN